MSTPPLRRKPRSPSPTRQQLDELDALLERMLSLPVSPTVEEPTSNVAPPALPSPPTTLAPLDPVLPDLEPLLGADEGPLLQKPPEAPPFTPITPPPEPFAASPARSRAWLRPLLWGRRVLGQWVPWFRPAGADRATTLDRPVFHPFGTVGLEAPPVPLWLRPVIWSNQRFDRWTLRLGPYGRWLRRPRGRAVVGGLGLALLAVALGVLILDWIGWPW
jgi:hypothetical protein